MKCNNCGYCQNHCNCECSKCEIEEPEIIEGEPFWCGTDKIDEIEIEPESIEEETEDNPDIIYCYD